MLQSKIRIMFRTSHPESTEYIPLTSKVLDYGGKKKLEEYPYFDPDIEFTDDMRRKIQNKTYDEKLELFFIKDNYANEIGYSIQDTKPRKESTSHIDAFIIINCFYWFSCCDSTQQRQLECCLLRPFL